MSISAATPLYEFLRQCNLSPLPKKILDCGAGWAGTRLALFYQHGYESFGLEINREALDEAAEYARRNDYSLNLVMADMRHIPFADKSFSFAYSYNAVSFMTKPDIGRAMLEVTARGDEFGNGDRLGTLSIVRHSDAWERRLPESSR